MVILPRKSLVSLIHYLVMVCILFVLLVPSPARADVGVQPILPGGSNIKPEGETPIQMLAEKVVMTVRQGTEADNAAFKLDPEEYGIQSEKPLFIYPPYFPVLYLAVAEVAAEFTMANPTSEAVSMTVWFPLASVLENAKWEEHPLDEIVPRIENLQVAVNRKPLDFSVVELLNPKGKDKPPLPWASFPVTFPAGEEILIKVSYVFLPQPTAVDLVGMTLSYVFQTGAGWAGPIGKAELEVNLPYPASAETIGAMPEGGQVEGQQVHWTWANLEPGPQDDFSILLLRPERWEELQDAQAHVKDWPDYGQGWLTLATIYERLSQGVWERGHIIPNFGETYQPLGVQAAQEAARLLPDDVGPHYILAMLYSSALPQNPSPEALQPVLDEMKIMKEIDPALAQALKPNVYDILEWVLYNDATATAEAVHWAAENATETAKATLYNDATATADAVNWACWATAEAECTATPSPTITPIPSTTPQSQPIVALPTPTVIQPVGGTSRGQNLIIIVAASLIGLVIVGYLLLKKKGGPASK